MRRTIPAIVGSLLITWTPWAGAAPCAGFTDVDDSSGFCANVEWMKNRGITLGLTPTLYDPNSPVTRLQMAAFMYRLGFQNAFLRGGNAFGATAVLGTSDAFAVELQSGGERVMRYEPDVISPNLIGGSLANAVGAGVRGATVGGGGVVQGEEPSFPSASANRVGASYGTIGGGAGNVAGIDVVYDRFATVGGGLSNTGSGDASTVAGGNFNVASGSASSISGGAHNTAAGTYAAVLGGFQNIAAGNITAAAGRQGNAAHDGCFVWADSSNGSYTSCFAQNEFVARSLGGFYFWTSGSDDNTYAGARLATGTGAWAAYSDVNGKERLDPVDATAVLDKLVAMPISTWQWKAEPGNVRHIGPTAQHFRAAFGLGDSDKQIVTVDADGVALAAIQGLNAKLEGTVAEQARENERLRAELADLRSLKDEVASLRAAGTRDQPSDQ